ncbi:MULTISPECIES: dihydrolipoamide acetyltransferase family protein [unclassified Leifsonia]|uniref:dihydrolipoamide acetyltransferase family protein n=1 Tax=unclassified Leifsonia TaxID=2663824 RepID=UPI0008A75C56|nr:MULTISPECIES: dihydrolipoamide acetyltransferase family protein [unclassified Leifsonia]SEI09774.1 pyruvate dehydrogenase E2 component (dihydrolipoamide acetyltransferase) [Leifsonia sp. CL154]SFL87610.1 pyruvate dehydrogenase E2 component (dihydrolipoamide acetyltransferase) [Leifsonia sp. CL147]
MTARTFTLPDLGEGLTDAELVHWLVAVGDTVTTDQPIAEVETAKSVVEVPSPFAGRVAALHGEEGETILVGAPLLEVEEVVPVEAVVPVEEDAGAAADPGPGAEAEAAEPRGSGQVLVGYGTTSHSGRRGRVSRASTLATPRASASAAASASAPASAAAPASASTSAPAPAPAPQRPRVGTASGGPVIPVISPVVRALARSHGIDLATVRSSRPDGVLTRRDVEAAFAGAPRSPSRQLLSSPDTSDHGGMPGSEPNGTDPRTGLSIQATTPFSRLRRTVAETMTRSRAEIPDATVWVDVDATDLWEGRRRLGRTGRAPSFLAFVSRFALAALARHPELAGRVSPDGDGVITFEGVNLGFAADTERGLLVPVVRRADRMSVRELDAELDRLARAAREGTLPPADLAGSTFTINNYGSLGVDGSAAIINHPEVAILGLGRAIERPWVVDGAIVPRRILQLSLVFDHRVTDGGVAAAFLREVADAVESPLGALADLPGSVAGSA